MHHAVRIAVSIRGLVSIGFILFVVASQIFWLATIRRWARKFIKGRTARLCFDLAGAGLYVALATYAFVGLRTTPSPTRLTASAALLEGPILWWLFSSVLGFAVYLFVRGCGAVARLAARAYRSARKMPARVAPHQSDTLATAPKHGAPPSPARRQFFRKAATMLGAVPFVAGAYGVLYGRLDLEITRQRIALPNLPRAFDGFRIAQLSDLHIGPFMTGAEIRRAAEIANRMKPDLIAVTGDYVTWDASTQFAAVDALAGLRAPYGVVGCLGNHEIWTHTEASITRLFAARGIHILRQEQRPIFSGADYINVVGVDFQTQSRFGRVGRGHVRTYLDGVEQLLVPGTVNILLSHNPNTFDRAAELDIDLSLAGHTHGGQVALEFVSADICPARLITPYVRGLFRKPGGQLYVNRGIGTIGFPIRLGASPEITVYQLVREA
ncbi:MAG: metallophosphoesterase [Terriglobia bacterium]